MKLRTIAYAVLADEGEAGVYIVPPGYCERRKAYTVVRADPYEGSVSRHTLFGWCPRSMSTVFTSYTSWEPWCTEPVKKGLLPSFTPWSRAGYPLHRRIQRKEFFFRVLKAYSGVPRYFQGAFPAQMMSRAESLARQWLKQYHCHCTGGASGVPTPTNVTHPPGGLHEANVVETHKIALVSRARTCDLRSENGWVTETSHRAPTPFKIAATCLSFMLV
jgi:hypothetical protein